MVGDVNSFQFKNIAKNSIYYKLGKYTMKKGNTKCYKISLERLYILFQEAQLL